MGRYSSGMLVKRNLTDEPCAPLALEGTKDVAMRVMVGRADGAPNFSLRQFAVGAGGFTPRHAHDYEHEVVVLGGRGTLEYDGAEHPVESGDVLLVRPNVTHQFRADRGSELRFLCLVPVSFDCGKPTPGS
jgi:quercetin dioxygenase-like cupin family protein